MSSSCFRAMVEGADEEPTPPLVHVIDVCVGASGSNDVNCNEAAQLSAVLDAVSTVDPSPSAMSAIVTRSDQGTIDALILHVHVRVLVEYDAWFRWTSVSILRVVRPPNPQKHF